MSCTWPVVLKFVLNVHRVSPSVDLGKSNRIIRPVQSVGMSVGI